VTTTQPQHQHKTTRKPKATTTTKDGWCNTQIHDKTTATLESPKDGGGLQPPKTKQTPKISRSAKEKTK